MTTEDVAQNAHPGSGWRCHLMWELRWAAVEMTGVVLGLHLVLGADQVVLGTFALLAISYASFLIHVRHYSALEREPVRRDRPKTA
jgi:hypothetical protein